MTFSLICFAIFSSNYLSFLMSVTAVGRNIQVKQVGTSATIPSNNYGRLMYYLSCVSSVVDFEIPYKYRNYSNYYSLSYSEKKELVVLCALLQPSLFMENHLFICDDEGRILTDYSNDFFEITETNVGLHVSEEIVIAGKRVRALKIMIFKPRWLINNYRDPLRAVIDILESSSDSPPPSRQLTYSSRPSSNYSSRPSSNYSSDNSCCSIA